MTKMSDWDVQVSARLTSHEFMLEILYANWFAQVSQEAASSMAGEILRRTRNAYTAADGDQEASETAGAQVVADSMAMTQRFLQKVQTRADQIRAAARG